jgi:hypothetical protein
MTARNLYSNEKIKIKRVQIKLPLGELLFVEYKWPNEQDAAGVWMVDESNGIQPAKSKQN